MCFYTTWTAPSHVALPSLNASLVFYCKRHTTKRPVTTMLIYPWKCTVLHCNHLGNTWKPLVLMTWHFDYCPSASEGDNQSGRSSAPVVSRCFPGGYNVKLYISRGRLAWWLLAFLHSAWLSWSEDVVCVCDTWAVYTMRWVPYTLTQSSLLAVYLGCLWWLWFLRPVYCVILFCDCWYRACKYM